MIIKDIHGHVNFRISHIHDYLGYTIIRDSRVTVIGTQNEVNVLLGHKMGVNMKIIGML